MQLTFVLLHAMNGRTKHRPRRIVRHVMFQMFHVYLRTIDVSFVSKSSRDVSILFQMFHVVFQLFQIPHVMFQLFQICFKCFICFNSWRSSPAKKSRSRVIIFSTRGEKEGKKKRRKGEKEKKEGEEGKTERKREREEEGGEGGGVTYWREI